MTAKAAHRARLTYVKVLSLASYTEPITSSRLTPITRHTTTATMQATTASTYITIRATDFLQKLQKVSERINKTITASKGSSA